MIQAGIIGIKNIRNPRFVNNYQKQYLSQLKLSLKIYKEIKWKSKTEIFFSFLSDPSPIIGYACQWLTALTHWPTDWLPFSKLDGLEWYQLLDDVATAT